MIPEGGQVLLPYPHPEQQLRQVHTITDRFSIANTYLINGARLVVVDPGSELNVRLTLNYLQKFLHRTPTEIDLIVLTHLHSDHTAGVEFLSRACNAPVAASATALQLAGAETQGKQGVPGIAHRAGEVLRQKALPATIQHLDLFPPHDASQMKLIDMWLEYVAGLTHNPDVLLIVSAGQTLSRT